MTSPTFRYCGGFMPMATPGGVPVEMTSPGISVMNCDRYDTTCGTLKISVLVLPVWRRSPLTSSHMERLCGSATASRVTSQGPSGPKVSWLLPLVHWPWRLVWKSRSETSFITAKPATWFIASASETYFAFVPMTTASSTSQSRACELRGISTSSFGPQSALSALAKTIGSVGGSAPVSAAWSE